MDPVLAGYVPFGPVRTYEFFNDASWDCPSAEAGQLLVDLQLVEGADPGTFAMQVGINSEHIDPDERPPMVLTFSVDPPSSMSGAPIEPMNVLMGVTPYLRAERYDLALE